MLQNAVNTAEELRIVKTQAEHVGVRDGKHLSCAQYVSLLLSAAQAHDGQCTTKVNTRGIKRSVCNTDVNDTDPDTSFDDNFISPKQSVKDLACSFGFSISWVANDARQVARS